MVQKTPKKDKPYNRCLACPHREARHCDGPRTSAMPLERWCEFMRDMRDANGLSNAYIAEKAEVSLKTVESIMSLERTQDLMRETARRIEDAIIGSSNQYPCYIAFEEQEANSARQLEAALRDLERAVSDNRDYRQALDNIHASYQVELQTVRDEAQKKIDYLLEEISRLRQQTDYLRVENDRKAAIIDKLMQ